MVGWVGSKSSVSKRTTMKCQLGLSREIDVDWAVHHNGGNECRGRDYGWELLVCSFIQLKPNQEAYLTYLTIIDRQGFPSVVLPEFNRLNWRKMPVKFEYFCIQEVLEYCVVTCGIPRSIYLFPTAHLSLATMLLHEKDSYIRPWGIPIIWKIERDIFRSK